TGPPGRGKLRETKHRSVYLGIVRGAPLPQALALFDVANPNIVVTQRNETTVPAQALYFMNNPFILEQAKAVAERLLNEPAADDAERVDRAYRLFFTRPANGAEVERATEFIAAIAPELRDNRLNAWAG